MLICLVENDNDDYGSLYEQYRRRILNLTFSIVHFNNNNNILYNIKVSKEV